MGRYRWLDLQVGEVELIESTIGEEGYEFELGG